MALKVGELFASFGVQGVDEALKGVEAKCKAMESTLKGIGQSLGASITRPITSFAKSVYETGSAFDAQMSKVAAIAGISMDEVGGAFDDLAAKAKEMGATTSFTATEAGEALEYMAMAGWTDEQMLEALKPIMDLAAASGANLGTASDIVTDAMTAFGMSADEAAHFSDVLAAASSSANTNVEMMGETFKYVAPVAGSLGYSVEDMAVAIGLMANSGIKASSAGTALRNILTNMAKPTDDMKQAMEELGVSLDDGEGHMKDFATVMKELRKGFGGMKISQEELISSFSELDKSLSSGSISQSDYEAATARLMERAYGAEGALKAQAAAALAGKFGMSGLLAIVNASDDDFEKLTKAIQECDGATEKMVAKMLDNAQGDMVLFQSALDGVKMSLWDLSEGSVRSVIQQLTGMANAFIALDDGTRSAIIKLAAFAAAMGPAMLAGGKLLSVVQAIGPALSALTGPVGIAAAGFALIGLAAMDTDGKLGDSMLSMSNSVYKGMKDLSGKMQTGLKTLSKRIPAMAGKIGSSLANVVRSGIGLAADAVSGIGDIFQQNAGSFSNVAMQLVSSIVGGISTNLPKLLDGGAKIATGIISGLIRNIPSLTRTAISAIQSGFSALLTLDWGSYGKTILDAIASALGGLSQTLLGFASNWLDALDSVDWQHAGANIWNSIKNGISSAVRGAKNFLTDLILGSGISQGGVMSLANYGQTTWETIKSGFVEKSGDWLKKLVLGDDYQPDSSWGDVGVKIWGVITGTIDNLKAGAKNIIGQIVLGEAYTPSTTWAEIGEKTWNVITEKVDALKSEAKNIVGQIVLGEEYTAGTSWDQIGTAIWEAIKAKIDNLKAATKNIVGQIVLGEEYTPGTSWDQIGEAIWGAIGAKIEALKAAAKNIVGPVVLGEAYNEDTSSWHDISEKIWGAIGDKLVALKNATKNIVGKIALGEHYTADTTWGQIGEAIWTKIKERFAELKKNALGLIGKLVLGEEYTADTSWQDVGIAIWDMIKAGFAALSKNAKDIIGRLALGSEYKADDTWSDVGEAIWKKAKEGIKDTGDWLKVQLGYQPSDAWKTVGGGVWKKIRAGINGTGDWLKAKLGYEPSDSWKTIGGDLFDKIKDGLGDAVTAAGDWIKTSLGFTVDDSWKTIGGEIFPKISAGLTEKMGELGFTIGTWIHDLFSSDDGVSLWDTGVEIAGFLWEGIKGGLTGLLGGLINFISGLLRGAAGMDTELDQAFNGMAEQAVASVTDGMTAADEEFRSAGMNAALTVLRGYEQAVNENADWMTFAEQVKESFMQAYAASTEGALLEMEQYGGDPLAVFKDQLRQSLTNLGFTEDDFASLGEDFWALAYNALQNGDWESLQAFLLENGAEAAMSYNEGVNGVPVTWDAVFNTSLKTMKEWQPQLEAALTEMGVEAGSLLGIKLPEGVANGLGEGEDAIKKAAVQLAEAAKVKEADTAKAVTDNKTTGESAGEAVATGMSNKEGDITTAGTTVEEAAVATFDTFAEDMKTPTDAAMVGVKEAITGHQSEISTASAEVSRDAVQKFAETMTAGEGKAIADSFMDAMNTAVSTQGDTLTTSAQTIASNVKSNFSGGLAGAQGHGIGYNFMTGLGNGISSRMYWLQSRAREVAAAAADAARSALNEHSPSRVMMQVGEYFTEGFGKGIMGAVGSAVRAAAGMAKAAINAVSMPMSSSAGKGFASDLSVALPRRAASGETVQRSTTYNNNSPLIVQQMNVRKESDIDAIAHEINALRARTAYGFGS